MKSCLALVATLALPFLLAGPAAASPLSYAFTGTTDAKGENTFSGTFTIDGDPTKNWDGSVSEVNDVSITLNAAGQTYHFSNQGPASHPISTAGFSVSTSPSGPWEGVPQDEIVLTGANYDAMGNRDFGVSMTFYAPTAAQNRSDLRTLDFVLGSGSIALAQKDRGYENQNLWQFTSVELVPTPTPEPSTWLIALIAGGAAALRLRRSA